MTGHFQTHPLARVLRSYWWLFLAIIVGSACVSFTVSTLMMLVLS